MACQVVGWGGWTLVYIGLLLAQGEVVVKGEVINKQPAWADLAVVLAANCCGLLLTHAYRMYLHRWRWADLTLKSLLPRVGAASLVLGMAWTAMSWPLQHIFVRDLEQTVQISRTTVALYSVFNGTVFMFVWSALYFGYHLFERFRRSEVAVWQLQSTAKEAELRALKSQVNPHFVFNSLNSLRALIDENPALARDAVTRLANLLRYSLKAGHRETVALEEELQIVGDFLALEQLRHEDRLRVKIDVAGEVLSSSVPPMLLQTLVENAVKYGIAPRREGGLIRIVGFCSAERLELRVENPGTLDTNGSSTGLGLRNAAERLRLLFGDRAVLRLEESPPGCVVASVGIPLARSGTAPTAELERAIP